MFDFSNVVSSDCTGQITFTNIPAGRWRFCYQVYRTSSEADLIAITSTVLVQDGVYFNWDGVSNDAFMYSSTFQSEYDDPVGRGVYHSVISSVSNVVYESYLTCGSVNEFTVELKTSGSFPTAAGTGMDALFTMIQVGPYAVSGAPTSNFIDDELAGGAPPG